ncbi:MAG: multidrug efflux SMR transporter [Anaerovoracaceae bacterium]
MGYIYLGLAIAGELIGTTFLKYSQGFTVLAPSLGSLLSYGICFFFFSKSMQTINLSIGYATWSGVGIIAATLISVFIFSEKITVLGVIGIVFMIIGVILLNFFGTVQS